MASQVDSDLLSSEEKEFFSVASGNASTNDARTGDARSDARSGDARTGDARSGDARNGDARSSDVRNDDSAYVKRQKIIAFLERLDDVMEQGQAIARVMGSERLSRHYTSLRTQAERLGVVARGLLTQDLEPANKKAKMTRW